MLSTMQDRKFPHVSQVRQTELLAAKMETLCGLDVEVRGEQLYTASTGVPVASAKLTDVGNLLVKHYGSEWRELDTSVLQRRPRQRPRQRAGLRTRRAIAMRKCHFK
ncbi:hypothetical protein GE061_001412 [Apolygus lucorum]|uniref:Uncharacterized protein n=1 Tax=Apolygus lucorum TaxID=248454 RepID=A0A8S9Y8Y8_APOLU|nr:hypothetical protein GE061_001412 [Apolygus lucorum]